MEILANLTDAQVAEARDLYRSGLSIDDVAARFDVSRNAMYNALRGTTWSHVPDPVEMRSPSRLGRPGRRL